MESSSKNRKNCYLLLKCGLQFECLPLERIVIRNRSVFLDAFEFLVPVDFLEKIHKCPADLLHLQTTLKIHNACFIVPEILFGKYLNRKSNVLILGNWLFYVFEVSSIDKTSF